jgi:alcohol dehydrogenase class IV
VAASKAVAAFESSTKLKQARDAVERKVAEWDKELFKAIKAPETLSESVVQTEIRAHLAAMTDNRLAFLDKARHRPASCSRRVWRAAVFVRPQRRGCRHLQNAGRPTH